MEVWTCDFRVIGITMRLAAKIQSHKHNNLSCSILICAFLQINPPAPNVEQKSLAFVG